MPLPLFQHSCEQYVQVLFFFLFFFCKETINLVHFTGYNKNIPNLKGYLHKNSNYRMNNYKSGTKQKGEKRQNEKNNNFKMYFVIITLIIIPF